MVHNAVTTMPGIGNVYHSILGLHDAGIVVGMIQALILFACIAIARLNDTLVGERVSFVISKRNHNRDAGAFPTLQR